MTRSVTASSAIRDTAGLSDPVAGHRADYWAWVDDHAEPHKRTQLIALRDHWQDSNRRYFDGRMTEPYITLTEPSAPQILGQCCPVSSWGSRLEIRLRPSLLDGTHPSLRTEDKAIRLQFVQDVLLHEMIHQHVMEHEPDINENSYHGHGPVFTAHANRIGELLGLPAVVVRNRKGEQKPKAAQWPFCVMPPERYGGAYLAGGRRSDRRIAIPRVCMPLAVVSAGDDWIDVTFGTAVRDVLDVRISRAAAADLALLINDHLNAESGHND